MFFASTAHFTNVSPNEVAACRPTARIIDVREPHEFRGDLGHIPGAELVPLGRVAAAARQWNRDDEIVVVCRSGGRSAHAASELVALGFSRVKNMAGGMLRWNAEARETAR